VLHMLRMMLSDLTNDSDRQFMAMIRDFLEYYRGGTVNAADFQHQCELYLERPLGWFFEQWISGYEVPTVTCTHRTEPTADGRHYLWLEVVQRAR